ncbi:hypothetical protein NDU88_000715 [Pleurodeles waltl]|uniref:Uncharacterized protein n=1 Tax=Pleurodeles waltl TaxID=8319 RepID=A0AAV7P4I6_PLEWA|nr:hypothetical protein NDU88_000715 [Pleurodeles waltl]
MWRARVQTRTAPTQCCRLQRRRCYSASAGGKLLPPRYDCRAVAGFPLCRLARGRALCGAGFSCLPVVAAHRSGRGRAQWGTRLLLVNLVATRRLGRGRAQWGAGHCRGSRGGVPVMLSAERLFHPLSSVHVSLRTLLAQD